MKLNHTERQALLAEYDHLNDFLRDNHVADARDMALRFAHDFQLSAAPDGRTDACLVDIEGNTFTISGSPAAVEPLVRVPESVEPIDVRHLRE